MKAMRYARVQTSMRDEVTLPPMTFRVSDLKWFIDERLSDYTVTLAMGAGNEPEERNVTAGIYLNSHHVGRGEPISLRDFADLAPDVTREAVLVGSDVEIDLGRDSTEIRRITPSEPGLDELSDYADGIQAAGTPRIRVGYFLGRWPREPRGHRVIAETRTEARQLRRSIWISVLAGAVGAAVLEVGLFAVRSAFGAK